jgi:hypothetical protein
MLIYSSVCPLRAFYCEWLVVPRCRSQSIWLARPGLLQLFGLVCSSLALRVLSMPAARGSELPSRSSVACSCL